MHFPILSIALEPLGKCIWVLQDALRNAQLEAAGRSAARAAEQLAAAQGRRAPLTHAAVAEGVAAEQLYSAHSMLMACPDLEAARAAHVEVCCLQCSCLGKAKICIKHTSTVWQKKKHKRSPGPNVADATIQRHLAYQEAQALKTPVT